MAALKAEGFDNRIVFKDGSSLSRNSRSAAKLEIELSVERFYCWITHVQLE